MKPSLWPGIASAASKLLIVVGIVLLAGGGAYYGYAAYQAHWLNTVGIDERLDSNGATAGPPPGVPLREPPPVFEAPQEGIGPIQWQAPPAMVVRIPAIGLESKIVELGTTTDERGELVWETPKHAVGHHQGTANPGETGNVVLSGHINSPIRLEGNVFANLPRVKLGDEVFIETIDGEYGYRVVARKVVEPTEVSVMAPTAAPVVTLITCYPDWVFSHRLALTAAQIAFRPYNNT